QQGTVFPLHAAATPERIGADDDWAQVSVGLRKYLAVKKDGTLWRWGSWYDLTDAGVKALQLPTPVQTGTDDDWRVTTMGTSAGCAIKTSGALYCLGTNGSGLVGDGTNTTRN